MFDPRLRGGCTLCRRKDEAPTGHAFSWLRVAGVVATLLIGFGSLWKYTPLASWVEARATLAREPGPAPAATGAMDAALWERALQFFEPFEFGTREAQTVTGLGVTSYVPRDNLFAAEGRVSGRRPNRSEVLDGLRRLDAALLRYPKRFVRAAGFERLIWLCDVVKDGAAVGALAMPPAKSVVLDPNRFNAGIFHHEMFHMVDYRLYGDAKSQPGWDALNPAGSSYMGLVEYARYLTRGPSAEFGSSVFLTDYARASAQEDRAETFRVLMEEPARAAQARASSAVIDAKARYVVTAVDRLAEGSSVGLGLR